MLISGVLQFAIFINVAQWCSAQYCTEHYNIFISIDPVHSCYHTTLNPTLYEFQSYFVDNLLSQDLFQRQIYIKFLLIMTVHCQVDKGWEYEKLEYSCSIPTIIGTKHAYFVIDTWLEITEYICPRLYGCQRSYHPTCFCFFHTIV